MKNKYTLTIADIQLDVLSDAQQDEVEKISGIVDRKMREIYLHSRSCTKNEAALLCALEFCSERLEGQGRLTELEELTAKYEEVLRVLRTKCQEMTDEMEKMKSENELLRSLLTDKEKVGTLAGEATPAEAPVTAGEPAAPARPVSAREFLRQVTDESVHDATESPVAQTAVPSGKPSGSEKRKTGSMFDLLSFDEV